MTRYMSHFLEFNLIENSLNQYTAINHICCVIRNLLTSYYDLPLDFYKKALPNYISLTEIVKSVECPVCYENKTDSIECINNHKTCLECYQNMLKAHGDLNLEAFQKLKN